MRHLAVNCVVAVACAALVFGLWFPYPWGDLVGGRELFLLVVVVDAVCGPLLTLVVFDRQKGKRQLWRDMGVVVLIQLAALAYGLDSVLEARPVFLAFEGDRFRVVSVADVDLADIQEAPPSLRRLSLRGPRLIGVKLAQPTDADFPQSIQLAMQGDHPAFRPGRWVAFDAQRAKVIAAAKPLSHLRAKYPSQQQLVDEAVAKAGMEERRLGYLPLLARRHSDWVVVVSREDGKPRAYLPIDGFF